MFGQFSYTTIPLENPQGLAQGERIAVNAFSTNRRLINMENIILKDVFSASVLSLGSWNSGVA